MPQSQLTDAAAPDTAGVVARPPLLFLGALGAALGLDAMWPAAVLPDFVQYPLAVALLGLGAGLVFWCRRRFVAAGTNVETWKPTAALVVEGPYRYSRNPIYLGLSTLYLGLATLLDTAWALALAAPLLVTLRYGVVAREERYLERRFGAAYLAYKARVRRWL